MFSSETIFFVLVIMSTVGLLLVDLLLVGKKSHVVSMKEAAIWTSIWVFIALAFGVFLYYNAELLHGINNMDSLKAVASKYLPNMKLDGKNYEEALGLFRKNVSINFFTAYLIEETLSVDNLFVILIILTSFSVEEKYYKRVLFWGILGAIILRGLFIFAGVALVHRFEWLLLIFGAFLVFSGGKMMFSKEKVTEPQNHFLVKTLSRFLPITKGFERGRFLTTHNRRLFATPLLLVLIMVEFTDLIFALDSIPAIFSVSLDPYIVFFSNIFAVMGLRSLFFLLIGFVDKFRFLKPGISFLLVLVGVKLLIHKRLDHIGFQSEHFLYIVIIIIGISVLLSVFLPEKEKEQA
jgi:tellurite resistance protein TerC